VTAAGSPPAGGSKSSLKRPKILATALRWAEDLQYKCDWGEGQDGTGARFAVLIVHINDQLAVAVKEHGKGLMVFAHQTIPEDVRAAIREGVGEKERKEALLVLQGDLLQLARVGFNLQPHGITSIDLVESIGLNVLLRIDDEDTATMNRYLDAIQEVGTSVVRVALAFGTTIGASKGTDTTYQSASPPPTDIYR
jgi:hypothetical protein